MEETKQESGKTEGCACQHMSMVCAGNAHRYCFKRCCMIRTLGAVIILGAVFAAGVCAGGGGRHEQRGEFGRHGYSRGYMMEQGEWGRGKGGYYLNSQQGAQQIRGRMMGTVPTTTTITTTSVTGTAVK